MNTVDKEILTKPFTSRQDPARTHGQIKLAISWKYKFSALCNSLDRISICSARFEVVVINPIYHWCCRTVLLSCGGCAVALKPPGQWVLERESPQRTLNICVVTTDWSWLHYLTPTSPTCQQPTKRGDKVVLQFLLRYRAHRYVSAECFSLPPR